MQWSLWPTCVPMAYGPGKRMSHSKARITEALDSTLQGPRQHMESYYGGSRLRSPRWLDVLWFTLFRRLYAIVQVSLKVSSVWNDSDSVGKSAHHHQALDSYRS